MRSILLLVLCFTVSVPVTAQPQQGCVILLHGLARTADSMEDMQAALSEAGFHVVNVDYPSRDKPIDELATLAVEQGLTACKHADKSPVNFVTHSLGGILVRQYYSDNSTEQLHRVVMLGPPNQGSQVVDNFKNVPGFELLNGPAGLQLGTDDNSVPNNLGAVTFELGVIAGTQSINLILSSFLPNPDDGKVSVANTKVDGMCGFLALPVTHPLMMNNDEVIKQVIHFLQQGQFKHDEAEKFDCGN